MKKELLCLVLLSISSVACAMELTDSRVYKEEAWHHSAESLYELSSDEQFRDITDDLSESSFDSVKLWINVREMIDLIKTTERKFCLFTFPSNGYQIKAVMSYIPSKLETAPLLLFLRGGNRLCGLMHPANSFSCLSDFTVVSPEYGGGVSEGKDEFGGTDVDTVQRVIDFIPQVEKQLGIMIRPSKKFILGGSRGGMQMFLALQRYPELQDIFDKCVSLSGGLNIRTTIKDDPEMELMFRQDFGLTDENKDEWLGRRNPIEQCDALKDDLPILIIQGTQDNRINVSQGRDMVERLKALGKNVTYHEAEGAIHCLGDRIPERDKMISEWLEN